MSRRRRHVCRRDSMKRYFFLLYLFTPNVHTPGREPTPVTPVLV